MLDIKNLQEPITIKMEVNGPSPSLSFSGAYWDKVQWSKRKITTEVEGYEIYIKTTHLSAFSLMIDLH